MLPSAFLWALALALASTCLAAESLYKTLGGLSITAVDVRVANGQLEGTLQRLISRKRIVLVASTLYRAWTDKQKLSKKYHPDLNPDEAAHEKFIEVAKGTPSKMIRANK
jgi:DnaJ-related protein SCJ1